MKCSRSRTRDSGFFRNLPAEETVFNQFIRLRKRLVIALEFFNTEENLSLVLMPTVSKDMVEQLKLAHKVVTLWTVPTERFK